MLVFLVVEHGRPPSSHVAARADHKKYDNYERMEVEQG